LAPHVSKYSSDWFSFVLPPPPPCPSPDDSTVGLGEINIGQFLMIPYIAITCKGCNSYQRSIENLEAYVVSKFILISKIPPIAPLTMLDKLGHDAVFI
jgi:hypothetical protein